MSSITHPGLRISGITPRRQSPLDAFAPVSFVLALVVAGGLFAPSVATAAVTSDHDYALAFSTFGYHGTGLYAERADGSGAVDLTPADTAALEPAWAPDGRHIAYTHKPSSAASSIVVVGPTGDDARNLTAGSAPIWAPDSSRIAYIAGDGIESIGPDGSSRLVVDPTPATSVHSCPSYSPDGTMIVSDMSDYGPNYPSEGHHELRVVRADGHGLVGSYDTSLSDVCASWSPDSRLLVFSYAGHITTIHPDASSPHLLTNGPCTADLSPQWAHDGTRIMFTRSYPHPGSGPAVPLLAPCPSGGTDGIWSITADGARDALIHAGPGFNPIWSPDDRLIAYGTTTTTGSNCTNCTYDYINIVHPDGTGYHQLPSGGGAEHNDGPTFAPYPVNPPSRDLPAPGPSAPVGSAPRAATPGIPDGPTTTPPAQAPGTSRGLPDAAPDPGSTVTPSAPASSDSTSGHKPRPVAPGTSRAVLVTAIGLVSVAGAVTASAVRRRRTPVPSPRR